MKHTHKYELLDLSRQRDRSFFVYICRLPNCSHYLRYETALNKDTICWGCGEITKVLRRHIDRKTKKILCEECRTKQFPTTKTKEILEKNDLEDFISRLGVQ